MLVCRSVSLGKCGERRARPSSSVYFRTTGRPFSAWRERPDVESEDLGDAIKEIIELALDLIGDELHDRRAQERPRWPQEFVVLAVDHSDREDDWGGEESLALSVGQEQRRMIARNGMGAADDLRIRKYYPD